MPQLVKKRRSGWAVLAAAAMVASILAVGATPAAAAPRLPDQQAEWKVCLGPATESADFTDVEDSSVHASAIDCIAYYGITQGKTDDTFDPSGNVTRSQMALFLARAADVAGIDLGDAMEFGYTDIGDADAERRSAINRLATKGIMFGDTEDAFEFGTPSQTIFAPAEYVTRWEMAMFLFAFLDHTLDSVVVDQLPDIVEGNDDGVGRVELNAKDGIGQPPDDYFRDALRETPARVNDRISALYELGVTTGIDGRVGEQGIFDPYGNVTRAQMASFITRALNHTDLRPRGVSAQQTSTRTQIAVRNADFEPIPDVFVEAFGTNDPVDAFNSDGECVLRYTSGFDDRYNRECQIDAGDLQTDGDGYAVYGVGSATINATLIQCSNPPGDDSFIGVADYRLMAGAGDATYESWAWTGPRGEEVDDNIVLAPVEDANTIVGPSEAVKAVVSGGNPDDVHMGETLTYTVQLVDAMGNPTGPIPGASHALLVTVTKNADSRDGVEPAYTDLVDLDTTRYPVESDGSITISVKNPDPKPFGQDNDNADVQTTVTIARAPGNNLPLADATMGTVVETTVGSIVIITSVTPPPELFSDNPPVPTKISAEPESSYQILGSGDDHTLTLTVSDQYGDAYGNTDYVVRIDPGSTADGADDDTISGHVYNTGLRRLTYDYGKDGPSEERIKLAGAIDPPDGVDADGAVQVNPPLFDDGINVDFVDEENDDRPTVYWANIGRNIGAGTGVDVLLIDADGGVILLDNPEADPDEEDTYPVAFEYGDDDKFVVEGVVVTYDQFQEIVSSMSISLAAAELSWEGFDYNRRSDNATWRLTGIRCLPPTGGD